MSRKLQSDEEKAVKAVVDALESEDGLLREGRVQTSEYDWLRVYVKTLLDHFRDPPPVPILIHCPLCKERHIDEGVWATRRHHTHSCQGCGHTWRPAVVDTVGVRFLPGFKNEEDKL